MPTQAEQYARMMGGSLAGSRPNTRSIVQGSDTLMPGLLSEGLTVPRPDQPGVPPDMRGILTPDQLAVWDEDWREFHEGVRRHKKSFPQSLLDDQLKFAAERETLIKEGLSPEGKKIQRANQLQEKLWEEQDTGELNYGPDDPRIQPALVRGQYELVGPGGKRELVGERRQGRSVTIPSRPPQVGNETLRRGDQWQQPNQVASTSAILDQIRAAVEAGLISPARAKELLMRLQGSMPPQ